MLFKVTLLVLVLVFSAGLFFAGYTYGKRNAQGSSIVGLTNPESPIFANLTGTVEGKIVKVEGEKAFVETKKGGKVIFRMPEKLMVNEINKGRAVELGMSSEALRLGQDGYIKLSGFGNGFAISAVTYVSGSIDPVFEDADLRSE